MVIEPFRPFDQSNALTEGKIIKTKFNQLLRTTETVEIKMIEVQPRCIMVHQGKRRAGDRGPRVDSQTTGNTAGQYRLPGTQIPL